MKVTLEINERQAHTLKEALELYARIGMGQLHELNYHPAFQCRDYERDEVDQLLDHLKHTVFTDLYGRGHSYGIRHENTHEASKEAYDIYQVIRHRLAWHKKPEGNRWSVDFDEPTQFSQQPLAFCKIEPSNEGSE